MSVLERLADSISKGKKHLESRTSCEFQKVFQSSKDCKNLLAAGDSRDFMIYLKNHGYERKFKAIYMDPPFFSKAKYNSSFILEDKYGDGSRIQMEAYDDRWNNSIDTYIEYITSMIYGIYDLLADDGVIILHIDWHACHYCRIILDELFGSKNFVNEIIWTYKSGGAGKRSFAKKHDNILIYSKTKQYTYNQSKVKSYNRELKKYGFKGVEEFQDEKGWYTLVNERDVWFIDMVGRTSKERTGYATQKPKLLIEKLINAFTNKGDLVGDFCAGSGTVAKVCDENKRNWICADINNSAISMMMRYLCSKKSKFNLLWTRKDNFHSENPILTYENGKFVANLHEENLNYLADKLSKESMEKVIDECTKFPNSLINFISYDFNYNGQFHHSDYMFSDGKQLEEFKNKQLNKDEMKNIHIMYADVFGNFSEKEELLGDKQ